MHLVEFAYNNGYQASTNMRPFEIMYGRKCTTHVSWDSRVDHLMIEPKMLQDMDQTMQKVQKNMKVAWDHQKS